MTPEQILAKLFELRKDYNDDEEDPTYQALHHACLFISYKIGDFKAYLQEAERLEKESK
jgi:hypothetical protein